MVISISWVCISSLKAQLNRGIVEGTLTDPQGAVVPGVSVTVLATGTNVSQTTKTNGAGYFRVVDLVPGQYELRFEAEGFSPLIVRDVVVRAGEVVRWDEQLKVGPTQQRIEVKAGAQMVETAPTNASTGLGSRDIEDMPLQGRDLQQLVFMIPGVVGNGPVGSSFGFNSQFGTFPDPTHVQGGDVSVNGGRDGANAWYLDGNLNISAMAQNVVVNPSPDATSEFQAITNAFSAEYGRTAGGVFNVVLKSGTNGLHGNIYEYDRNSYFNARNPFTSIGPTGQIIPQDQLRYNDFGGSLGGPLVLPHIYDGRNKTFFFFSWDSSVLHLNGNNVFTVPTPSMLSGDFSEDPNSAQYGIWNPYSTAGPNGSGVYERTAFGTPAPGNPYGADGCLNSSVEAGAAAGISTCNFATQVPASMLDPTAMWFLKQFPSPNYNDPLATCPSANGGGYRICDNFLGAVGSSQVGSNISLKLDENWSEKSHFFGEWLYNPLTYNNYRLPWTGPTLPATGFGSALPFNLTNQILALGNTYTLSPTLINEFRLSYSRSFYTTHPTRGAYPPSISGINQVEQQLAPLNIPEPPLVPLPSWTVSTPGGGGLGFGTVPWTSNFSATEAYTVLDNVVKVLGKHTLKSGFMYRLDHAGSFQSGLTNLVFNGQGSSDPTTGLGAGAGLATLEMGAVMQGSAVSAANSVGYDWNPYLSFTSWGAYFQDDYRITPRFTLNLGLRYDVFGVFRTRQQPLGQFCLDCTNPDSGLPGLIEYSGHTPGFPSGSTEYPPNHNDLGPRINFSWSPFGDNKTVIRGGYDVFYSNEIEAQNTLQAYGDGVPGTSAADVWDASVAPSQCAAFSGQCASWKLSSGAAPTVPQFTGGLGYSQLSQGYTLSWKPVLKPSHDPMVQSWLFQLERELPGHVGLTVGYTGNHGTHLLGGMFVYAIPTSTIEKYQESLYSTVPITNFYSGKAAQALTQAWGTSNLSTWQLLSPYPMWSFMESAQAFNGTDVYHALNVRLHKHYSQGFDWNVAYTFSKTIVSPQTYSSLAGGTVDAIHEARSGLGGGLLGAVGAEKPYSPVWQDNSNINANRSLAPYDIPQMLTIAGTYELPVGRGKKFISSGGLANAILGGWRLGGMFTAQSGVPLTITGPCDGVQGFNNGEYGNPCLPDLVGKPTSFGASRTKEQRIAQWFNPAAFQPSFGADQSFWANPNVNAPNWWQFGNADIRLPGARSPGFWNLDTSLNKDFHVNEREYLEFRWDVFNTLNHQNLGLPNTNYCLPPGPGGETDLVHQAGCSFGLITNIATDPRAMQFGLRFIW
jgi:hypothetical protein